MPANPTPAEGVVVPVEMIEAFRDWYALHRGRPIMKGKARKIVGRILAARPAAPTQSAAQTGEVEYAFNVNDSVRLKLTDEGRNAAVEHWGRYGIAWKPPQEDAHGYSRWQLWDVMQTFGPKISLGRPVPFETAILISSQNLALSQPEPSQ